MASYRFFVSSDGVNWGSPIKSGELKLLGANAETKTVYFDNVALGKVATQSTTASLSVPSLAGLAVDGNVDGNFNNGSVTHTNSDANAWWEVDLGSPQTLHTVRVWNRSDAVPERLTDFHLLLSSQPMTGKNLATLLVDTSVTQLRITGIAGLPSTHTGILDGRPRGKCAIGRE